MKLLTKLTKSMSNREGYLDLKTVMDETFQQYTFNDILKLRNAKPFDTWILYYEDSPLAVKMTVRSDVLVNGFVRVLIIDRELKGLDEVPQHTYGSSVYLLDENKKTSKKAATAKAKAEEQNKNVLTPELRAAIFGTSVLKPEDLKQEEKPVPELVHAVSEASAEPAEEAVPERRFRKYERAEHVHYNKETMQNPVLDDAQKLEAVQRIRSAWSVASRGK